MTGFEAFVLVWASAFAGACLSEWFRRTFEARKSRRKLGRMTSDWMPRTTTRRPK